MGRRLTARQTSWLVLAILMLGHLPGRLAPTLLTARDSGQKEQTQEGADDKLSEAEKPGTGILRPRRLEETPTLAWLVLREPHTRAHRLRLQPLAHEDPRHVLLPRRTAPPSDDPT